MTTKILKWRDRKLEELNESEEFGPKTIAKAFGLGAIEGLIDGLVIDGAMLCAVGIFSIVKNAVKKK